MKVLNIPKEKLKFAIPMFPLNTDGIDPSGRNFRLYNLTIKNYVKMIFIIRMTRLPLNRRT